MFHFKKFSVEDFDCTMKVGTDAVLLGAWTQPYKVRTILDIGTGCGILALMMAQKSDALIDAVEIDDKSSQLAFENFRNSLWHNRIKIHHAPLANFFENVNKKYNLIISNPPFFRNSLPANSVQKNLAKHDSGLSYEELIKTASQLLFTNGTFNLILPFNQKKLLESMASSHGLKPIRITDVQNSSTHKPVRSLFSFVLSENEQNCEYDQLIIRDTDNSYSNAYKELTKDFLLNS